MTPPPTDYLRLAREVDEAFAPVENPPPQTDEDAPAEQQLGPITAEEVERLLDDDIGAALRPDVFDRVLRVRANPEEWFRIEEIMRRKKIKRAFNDAVKLSDRKKKRESFSDWRQGFITKTTKDGDIVIENCLSNVVLILEHDASWNGVLGFDDFSEKIALQSAPPFARQLGPWGDNDTLETKSWIELNYPLKPRTDAVFEAIQVVCNRNRFNPLTNYLRALKPGKEPTIDTWLSDCFGAPDTKYTRAIGRMWLVSAVARAFEPGVKVDTVLILEGNQGLKKSRVLEQLCPNPSWFTDGLSDFGSKDQAAEIQGKWIVELGELKGFRKDLERLKAFVTRRKENYRPAYGRHVVEQPRKCVFAGTVNPSNDGYLIDETGNRRFWPIECTKRAPEITKEFRDSLWAQAVAVWISGEEWWIEDEELQAMVGGEQKKRVQTDPWQKSISDKLIGKTDICIDDVFDALRIEQAKWTPGEASRIGRVLKMLGWIRYRESIGDRNWRYRKPVTEFELRMTS